MSDPASPLGRDNDEQPSSPKRKKIRQKYAPKACVSCRRSKLKCSGDNPCQRCRDNGKRCFYSEDQTAAEALQNLSRPSVSQQPSTSASISNGNGFARRNIMPRHQAAERRAGDAGALGLSMEARMARVEAMMETLLQDRAVTIMAHGGMERSESGSDMAISMPLLDPINPALALLGQSSQNPYPQGSPASAIDPLLSTDTTTLRIGSRSIPFPTPIVYQGYIDSFFRELQCFHPCVNERLFRTRSGNMVAKSEVHSDDACFLALNYIIFAWRDALSEAPEPTPDDNKPAGWHWLQIADDVVGRRQFYGQGDVSLAQFLVFKALYCALIDQPCLAYNTIGLASRYVLQQGLNRRTSHSELSVWETYERLQVFWIVMIVDRRISMSCGRPYTIRDIDIDVERPSDMYKREIVSNMQPLDSRAKFDGFDSANAFMDCMIHWSRFAGSLWDSLLAAHVSTNVFVDKVATFDAAITDFFDNTFPELAAVVRPSYCHDYIQMSFDNLRLLAPRAVMMTLQFDGTNTHVCSKIVVDTAAHISAYDINTKHAHILRHYMIPSLSSSLLMLCSLLVSDLRSLGHSLDDWVPVYHQLFDTDIGLLQRLAAQGIPLAQRVLVDFGRIIPVIETAIAKWFSESSLLQASPSWDIIRGVFPQNTAELLPYREQAPDIHFPYICDEMWTTNGGFVNTNHGSSAWDGGIETGNATCRVLWI